MLQALSAAARPFDPPTANMDLLLSVLESAEVGVVVADASARAAYMNASARAMLDSPLGVMPPWLCVVARSPSSSPAGPADHRRPPAVAAAALRAHEVLAS